MTHIKVMKQALEALEEAHYKMEHYQDEEKREQAITALKQGIAQDALDKMADNARELGLDYEAPPEAQTEAEKTAYAFGWCKAMEYARQNGVITSQPVPVKTYHDGKPWPVAPKPWVGLTDYEIGVCSTEAAMNRSEMVGGAVTFARAIEAKLKEKNHG